MKALAKTPRVILVSALFAATLAGCQKADQTGASGTSGSSSGTASSDTAGSKSGSTAAGSTTSDSSGASNSSSTAGGAAIDDSIITTKVKTALLGDSTVKGTDINVETKKGEVMLSGFVGSQSQIDKARQIAQNVEGVKKVNNKMSVKQ